MHLVKATTGYHGRKFGRYVCRVKDTCEDARTQVKTSIGVTGKITVRF